MVCPTKGYNAEIRLQIWPHNSQEKGPKMLEFFVEDHDGTEGKDNKLEFNPM